MDFLHRVLDLITSRGISKNKLLTDIKINKNAFVDWDKNKTIPGGDVVAKIADYFHVSTDYLLGRTDDPSPVEAGEDPSPLRSTLLGNFARLNQEGQEKLADYSDDLVTSGTYIKTDPDQLGKTKNA